MILNSPYVTGSLTVTGNITASGGITISGSISSASYSANADRLDNLDSTSFVFTSSYNTDSASVSTRVTKIEGNYATTGSNVFIGGQTVCGNITSTGTIIAQTLNVQQVTSSIVYSSGSNTFGCQLTDVQQMTGSVRITGSLNTIGIACFSNVVCTPQLRVSSTGDLSYIYNSGASTTDANFYIYSATKDILMVRNSGCIGIGTANPTKALEIVSNTSQDGIKISGTSNPRLTIVDTTNSVQFDALTTDTEVVLRSDTNHPLHLSTNGTLRLNITNTGIACFSCQVCAPKLVLNNAANADTNAQRILGYSSNTSGHIGQFSDAFYLSSNWFYNGAQSSDCSTFGAAAIVLQASTTGGGSYIDFATQEPSVSGLSSKLRIQGGGIACFACQVCAPNLLISNCATIGTVGFSYPEFRLAVAPTMTVVGNGAGSVNEGIYFKRTSNLCQGGWISGNGGALILVGQNKHASAFGDIYFSSNNGTTTCDIMVIDGVNQRVGIGTTTPYAKFEVLGGNQCPPSTGTQNYTMALRDPTSMVCGVGGSILFQGYKTGTAAIGNFAYIAGKKENGTAGNEAGYISLGSFDSAGNAAERMRITSGGCVGIGTISPDTLLTLDTQIANFSTGILASLYASKGTAEGTYLQIRGTRHSTQSVRRIEFQSCDGSSNAANIVLNPNGGCVGIGTFTPNALLTLQSCDSCFIFSILGNGGNSRLNVGTESANVYMRSQNSVQLRFGVDSTNILALLSTGVACVGGNLSVCGTLSKSSGTFRINHPLPHKKCTHALVHSFIEGPQADLIYRGKINLDNGVACVNIDCSARMTEGTFEALNRCVQVFTTNESSWDQVKGRVIGNVLIVESQNTESNDEISWMVIGERQDEHMLETEWTDEEGRVITEPEIKE